MLCQFMPNTKVPWSSMVLLLPIYASLCDVGRRGFCVRTHCASRVASSASGFWNCCCQTKAPLSSTLNHSQVVLLRPLTHCGACSIRSRNHRIDPFTTQKQRPQSLTNRSFPRTPSPALAIAVNSEPMWKRWSQKGPTFFACLRNCWTRPFCCGADTYSKLI